MASRTENRGVNIYINGKQAEGSLKDLKNRSRELSNELAKLTPGTEAFRKKVMELRSVNQQLLSIRNDIKGVGESFSWLRTEVGKLGAIAAGAFGLGAISNKFNDIVAQNREMSDTIADVMKTTGLTELAVRRMNAEFKKIDTRTSREELNQLAVVAGKLGISAEQDVLAFVRAADKISVSLGEDLGGSEEAINALGKIVDIFDLKKVYGVEDALLRVGSAINDLGADGTANEGYIVQWTNRLAGIAPKANISLQAVLALAAVMDQNGQMAETSSTAIGQFLVLLGKDVPKFAKIAGLSTDEFAKILEHDAVGAMGLVLEKSKSSAGGIQGLADSMGLMGVKNSGAVTTLGVLADKFDQFKTRLDLANKSFDDGTSITTEFDTKNNNLAARIDKLKKKFTDFETNFTFNDLLIKGVIAVTSFVNFIDKHLSTIVNFGKVILTAVVALTAYKSIVLLCEAANSGWIKTLISAATRTKLLEVATTALGLAQALLTGNLKKARQEWKLLNALIGTNPWALLLAAVVAVGTALILFSNNLTTAQKSMKDFMDAQAEAQRATASERLAIERALKTIQDDTKSRDRRLQAVNDLRKIMPEILQHYTDEEILADKATAAINKQTEAILNRAKMRAYENQVTKLEEDNIKIDQELKSGSPGSGFLNNMANQFRGAFSGKIGIDVYREDLRKQKKENELRMKELEVAIDGLKDKELTSTTETTTTGGGNFTKQPSNADLKTAAAAQRKEESLQAQIDKGLERFQTKADKSQDGADSKLVEMEAEYKRLMELAKGHEEEQTQLTEAFGLMRQNRIIEILKEGSAKQREQMRKSLEAQQEDQAAADAALYKQKLDAIDKMNVSEQEKDIARQQLKDEHQAEEFNQQQENLMQRWGMLETMEQLGDLELEEANRIAQEKAAIEKQITDNAIAESERQAQRKLEIANRTKQAEDALREATVSGYEAGFSFMKNLFKKNKELALIFLIAEKAAAAASVIVKLQQEIAGYYAANAWLGPAGVAIASKLSLAAKIRAGVSIATIAAQTLGEFEDGGYSNAGIDNGTPTGWVKRPTIFTNSSSGRPFLAGEGFKPEYIISSKQLQDPVIADFVSMMEANRGIRRFEQGGYSSTPTDSNNPSSFSIPELQQVVALLGQLISTTENAQDKEVRLDWSKLKNYDKKFDKIKTRINS